jgi:hypothetical protein
LEVACTELQDFDYDTPAASRPTPLPGERQMDCTDNYPHRMSQEEVRIGRTEDVVRPAAITFAAVIGFNVLALSAQDREH